MWVRASACCMCAIADAHATTIKKLAQPRCLTRTDTTHARTTNTNTRARARTHTPRHEVQGRKRNDTYIISFPLPRPFIPAASCCCCRCCCCCCCCCCCGLLPSEPDDCCCVAGWVFGHCSKGEDGQATWGGSWGRHGVTVGFKVCQWVGASVTGKREREGGWRGAAGCRCFESRNGSCCSAREVIASKTKDPRATLFSRRRQHR